MLSDLSLRAVYGHIGSSVLQFGRPAGFKVYYERWAWHIHGQQLPRDFAVARARTRVGVGSIGS